MAFTVRMINTFALAVAGELWFVGGCGFKLTVEDSGFQGVGFRVKGSYHMSSQR